MKFNKTCLALLLISILATGYFYAQEKSDFPFLKGAYLGQKPPGMVPKVFAPEIVSTKDYIEFSCTFSPDGKEFYFNRGGNIMVCCFEGDVWKEPVRASFDTESMDHEPHITTDGNRLFFGSKRLQPGNNDRHQYGIWMVKRIGDGWGEPVFVGSGMYVTSSRKGNIYLTSLSGEDSSLVRTRLENDKFSEFEKLKGGVDSTYDEMHPCIAPDESYIIFDSNRPGSHQGKNTFDLYVCFKMKDGSWGEAINIGEKLNIKAENIVASLSPDGKFLFFNSMNVNTWDIYWVDAKIIAGFKPKELN